jgi:hypothetical protein
VIPGVVRNNDGHMYIMREYKEEMAGKKIPDNMVVRPANGRRFTRDKVQNFVMKSTPRCPTYGVMQAPNCSLLASVWISNSL